jgi:hypothetical protein
MDEVLAPAQRRDYELRNVLDDILALPCDMETKVDLMLAAGASARVVARLLNGGVK